MIDVKYLEKLLILVDFEVKSLTRLGSGDDCEAFNLNNKYVVKVPLRESTKLSLKKEFDLYDFLTNYNLTFEIPNVVYLSESFSILTLIKGEHLGYGDYQKLSKSQQELLAQDEATFLKALHSIKIDLSEPLFKDMIQDKKRDFIKDKKQLLNILKYKDLLNSELTNRINKFYFRLLSEDYLFEYIPCLVHNDFSSQNMIFRDNRLVGVIDFADFVIGDPDNDFLCILDESEDDFGLDFGRKVVSYYNHINPEIPFKKAKLNDEYWKVQQVLIGYKHNDEKMLKHGIDELWQIGTLFR